MRQGKALVISVVVTLLVSIGVIAFNATYAGNTPESEVTATAEPDVDRSASLLLTDDNENSWREDDQRDHEDDKGEDEDDDDEFGEEDDDEHEEDDD